MATYTIPLVTTAERTGYTPIEGEHIYDEDLDAAFVGDGSTVGGNNLKGDQGIQGPPGSGLADVVDDTSPQLGGFLDPNGNYIGLDKGGDLASASPLVLGVDGDYFDVTGTTGFAVMTVSADRFFMLQFDAVLTITNGASIVIPGGVNFTTAPGDQLLCFSTGTDIVRILGITKADGTPVVIDISKDTSPQAGGFFDPNGHYIGSDKGGDLASAASMLIGIDGDYFDVTGTTGFADLVVAANRRFRLQFDGVVTITVGSGIFLNNAGGNFTTAPGDVIDFQSISVDTVVGTITKANGTSPISGVSGAWNLLQTQVVSSPVASVEFTTNIDSTYITYVLVISNSAPSGNDSYGLHVSTDGGSTYKTTGYENHHNRSTTASAAYDAKTGTSRIELSDTIQAGGVHSNVITFHNPAETNYTVFHYEGGSWLSTYSFVANGMGLWEDTMAIDAIKIFMAGAANISQGTFSLYGITK